jgi:soluble lytic murein transglycosylase-like protein
MRNKLKERSELPRMSLSFIDPKLITAWLQTQFLSPSDLTSASLDAGGATRSNAFEGSEFAALLKLLTSSNGNGTAVLAMEEDSLSVYGLQGLANRSPLTFSAQFESPSIQTEAPADVEAIIEQASQRHGVDASLVHAVIQAESGFNPRAESHAGAKGLMQLMDATAKSLGVTDSFDPVQNVNGGTRFLSYLLTKYNGNESVALAAYNAGPGRVDRLGIRTDADLALAMDRLPKETQAYVGKVLSFKA